MPLLHGGEVNTATYFALAAMALAAAIGLGGCRNRCVRCRRCVDGRNASPSPNRPMCWRCRWEEQA